MDPRANGRTYPNAGFVCGDAALVMAGLAQREGVAARALAFLILTVARSGEVRGMTWGEVDLAEAMWTVPVALLGEP